MKIDRLKRVARKHYIGMMTCNPDASCGMALLGEISTEFREHKRRFWEAYDQIKVLDPSAPDPELPR